MCGQNIQPIILRQNFFTNSNQRSSINEKESPDVETPGLLVKALISSYFKKIVFD